MEDEPPYDIVIASETDIPSDMQTTLRAVVEATLRQHHVVSANISLALVQDSKIASLNQTYLNHEGPTDVISFDLRDGMGEVGDPNSKMIDGELVISVETASREATRRGHDVVKEVALYAVHGVLHLLGFDDSTEELAFAMHSLEDEILSSLGVGPVFRG